MRKLLILIFLSFAFSAQIVLPHQAGPPGQKQKIEDFKERYFGKNVRTFRNNVQVRISYYDVLTEIDRDSLSNASKMLLDDILAILNSPEDESLRSRFLKDFPKTFSEFRQIFNPSNFKELYDGSYVFLKMFDDILKERPQDTVEVLLGLSVNATYDADAPGKLQHILANFICNNYDFFISPFSKLASSSQQNIVTFVCDVEDYSAYAEFDCIVRVLKEKGNAELEKRFLAAKKERISIGPHGEKIRK